MSGRFVRQSAWTLALAGFSLVLSCASIPPTNYYVLGLPHGSGNPDGASKFPYAVSVAPFASEPAYLRKKIIWRSETNRLGYYSSERWAALPAEMFAFRLYERAGDSNLFRSVHAGGPRNEADLILGGRIIAFEELDTDAGSFGNVEVELELVDKTGKRIWSATEGHAEPLSGQGVEAVVKALAVATESVITEALTSIEESLQKM